MVGSRPQRVSSGAEELTDFLIFCDMTTSPDGMPVTVEERLSEILVRYGPDSIVARSVAHAGRELRAATLRVAGRLVARARRLSDR